MKAALAFPYNDPDGILFPHLQAILPDLKDHFERAYIAPPPPTQKRLKPNNFILTDNFFKIFPTTEEKLIGENFAFLYQHTAETAPPDQPIHLCYLDRLAFALEGHFRDSFLGDIDSL